LRKGKVCSALVSTVAALEIDADVGVRGQERAQRFGQEFRERVGIGKHSDLAGEPAGIDAEVLAKPLGLTQDHTCMLQQRAAGLGRRHPLPAAHEQRRAQRFLHVANARACGRQREMRALGTAGDAPRLDHVAKHAQIGEVEAHGLAVRASGSFKFGEGKLREIPIVTDFCGSAR
jgi:hypothetical protein